MIGGLIYMPRIAALKYNSYRNGRGSGGGSTSETVLMLNFRFADCPRDEDHCLDWMKLGSSTMLETTIDENLSPLLALSRNSSQFLVTQSWSPPAPGWKKPPSYPAPIFGWMEIACRLLWPDRSASSEGTSTMSFQARTSLLQSSSKLSRERLPPRSWPTIRFVRSCHEGKEENEADQKEVEFQSYFIQSPLIREEGGGYSSYYTYQCSTNVHLSSGNIFETNIDKSFGSHKVLTVYVRYSSS